MTGPEIGTAVIFFTGPGEEGRGIIVAVTRGSLVVVRDDETGELLTGNQWEEV